MSTGQMSIDIVKKEGGIKTQTDVHQEPYRLRSSHLRMRGHTALAQKLARRFWLDGWREEISLPQVATKVAEVLPMLCGFNTFRNHFQLQLVCQQNDQLHRVTSSTVSKYSTYEGGCGIPVFCPLRCCVLRGRPLKP